jgi:hypothetical protein
VIVHDTSVVIVFSQKWKHWQTTTAERKQADKRMIEVSAVPNGHFSGRLRIFQNTGSFKSADWIHLITTGMLHVLRPMLRGQAVGALDALVRIFRLVLEACSDRDPHVVAFPEDDEARRKNEMRRLKTKVARLLCAYERGAPLGNLPRIVHLLIHVPDLIFRWNSVRNMWCFFNERSHSIQCARELILVHYIRVLGFWAG